MTAFIITMTNIRRVGDTDIHIMCDRYNEDEWNIFISIVVRLFPLRAFIQIGHELFSQEEVDLITFMAL